MRVIQKLREWYWHFIKYNAYEPSVRIFFLTLEQGVRARKTSESTMISLLRLNIERARYLFGNDYVAVKDIDKVITTLGDTYLADTREMDKLDIELWRKIFWHFILTHDDKVTAEVWGAPIKEISDLHKVLAKSVGAIDEVSGLLGGAKI